MKKQVYFFIAGLITIFSCQQSTLNQLGTENEVLFNKEAEIAAIMKVIDNETNCFFDGNYEGWAKNLVSVVFRIFPNFFSVNYKRWDVLTFVLVN